MTEFLHDPGNEFTFRRGDVEDLERVIRRLLAAPDSLYARSETTHYDRTSRTMSADTFALYDDLSAANAHGHAKLATAPGT